MKKNILTLFLFICFCFLSEAQIVNCVAPAAGTPDCYQTSRVVAGSTNPLWNWPPLPHQDCCNAISLCKPRNEVENGVLIPTGAPTGTPFYPGCVQDELPDELETCFSNNEKCTTWYKFVITPRPNDDTAVGSYAGKLRFKILPKDIYQPGTITPIAPYPGDALDQGAVGYGNTDYDFLLFKVTDAAGSGNQCSAIKNSTGFGEAGSVIERCNWTGTRGPTGLFEPGTGIDAAAGTAIRFNAPLDVNVGDVFYLAIDNFSVNQQGFFVDFRSIYTADGRYAANDPTARVGSVDVRKFNITTTKLPACGIEKLVLNFDLAIDCDSITTTSFKVLGPNPPYVITNVTSQNCQDGKDTSFIFSIQTSKKDTLLTLVRNRVVRDFCGNTLLTDSVKFKLALPDSNRHEMAKIQPSCDFKKINIRLKHKVLCSTIIKSPFDKFKILNRSDTTEYCKITNISRTNGICSGKTMDSLYTFTLSKEAIDTARLAIYIDSLTATTIIDSCGDYLMQEGFIPFDILPVKIPFQIVNKPNCGDSKIDISFGKKVRCDSVKLGKFSVRIGTEKQTITGVKPTRGTGACPADGLDSLYSITLASVQLSSNYSISIDSGMVIRDKCGNPAFFASNAFSVNPFLSIKGIEDTVCPDKFARLAAILDTSYKSNLQSLIYTWNDNISSDTLLSKPNPNPVAFNGVEGAAKSIIEIGKTVTIPTPITYTLVVKNKLNGCKDTASIPVLFSPIPEVEAFERRYACFGETISIRPGLTNGLLSNFDYKWSRIANPVTLNKVVSSDSILNLLVSDSLAINGSFQKYQLEIAFNQSLGGCKIGKPLPTVDIVIGRKIEPKIGLIPDDSVASILPADFVFSNLTKFTPFKSTPSFIWDFGPSTSISSGYGNQNYRYTEPGKFQIKLTAQDSLFKSAISTEWGKICYKSDSVEIYTQNLIPSLVTSNGDGKNDFLSIQGMRPNTFSMKLYNRWGKLVGEQDPFDANIGWDPKDVGPGSYYYILTEKRSGKTIVSWLTISKD
jgi:hypothetical protein